MGWLEGATYAKDDERVQRSRESNEFLPYAIVGRDCNGAWNKKLIPSCKSTKDTMFLRNGSMLFKKVDALKKMEKCFVRDLEQKLRVQGELSEDEHICGVVDETMGEIKHC